jgi:hypothetical protein
MHPPRINYWALVAAAFCWNKSMNLLWRWGGAQQGGQRAIAARRCCGGAQFTVEPREQSLPLAAAHV